MNTQTDTTRQERYGITRKKNISITESAHTQIEEWAGENDMYFSVAIETLALLGLGIDDAARLPRLVSSVLEKSLNRHFRRFAKLISYAAIAAEETSRKSDILLLQQIWQQARQDPEHFIRNMQVSLERSIQPDARVRALRDQLSAEAHEEAVKRLRQPLAEEARLLQREADGSAGGGDE
jgi:hypothetical protein